MLTADAASPAASLADRRSSSPSRTNGRSSRRASRPPRSRCSARTSARISSEAIDDGERALVEPLDPELARFEHVVFLGHGWTTAVADEAALKLQEATRTYSEAYPAMEYRHGPISLAGERSLVWILGSSDPTVAEDVAATGATVRVASLDAMAELVLVHRAAVALAEAKGLDPDHPAHLTRSVVLP